MVVFTCQSCGDSLQKPKVEKHIQFVCRGSTHLTCVDCLKDFWGDEYVSHTQCVTELERYSGKGFTPKPNSQKGLTKQNLWTDMIKEVLKRTDLGQTERRLLSSIHKFHNIPRKQSKFQNFMKNSTGCSPSSADAVFKLLEAEWHKATKDKETKDRSSSVGDNDICVKSTTAQELQNSVNKTENGSIECEESKGRKSLSDDVKLLSKKEKKQKRKREKYLAEINFIESNTNIETKEMDDISSYKIAERGIKIPRESVAEENMNEDVQEVLSEKKKKKKRKHNDYNDGEVQTSTSKKIKTVQDTTEYMEQEEQEAEEIKDKNRTAFNWSDTIIQVLQSRSDRELSLKKLCKKVLAEYQAVKGDKLYESYEKLVAKFHKKVNKTVGVKVLKDRAKLMA